MIKNKNAFTLAETLITLGIIGIVAALTIPTLVQSYKKSVMETRIAHFSSLWQQAYKMAEAENGPSTNWDAIKTGDDPQAMLEAYNKYFSKYIKTVDTYKTPKGVAFALNNGSGFHLRKEWAFNYKFNGSLYLTFCVNYKACKALQDDITPTKYSDGKEIFSFYENGQTPKQVGGNPFSTRENLIENCKTMHYACSTLIEHDGWKIKEGYPIKI